MRKDEDSRTKAGTLKRRVEATQKQRQKNRAE